MLVYLFTLLYGHCVKYLVEIVIQGHLFPRNYPLLPHSMVHWFSIGFPIKAARVGGWNKYLTIYDYLWMSNVQDIVQLSGDQAY